MRKICFIAGQVAIIYHLTKKETMMSKEMIERSFQCSKCPTKCKVLITEEPSDKEDPNQCLFDDANIDAEWEQVENIELEHNSAYDKRLEELDIQHQELAIRRQEAEIATIELQNKLTKKLLKESK